MNRLKTDHQLILNKIRNLKNENWLGQSRIWWPDFVYHTTSLENVVQILKNKRIYSRNKALEKGVLIHDIADAGVISTTNDAWKDYVRFYLRPKTPTLFVNEGVKPRHACGPAHCCVPICLLFNSRKMLTREDAIYSDGNLATASTSTGSTAAFFEQLPFQRIYHTGGIGFTQQIKTNRCAEVIFPTKVDLNSLEYISCRSEAEKETLLHLLISELEWDDYMKWKDKIGLSSPPVFNEEWNFIRSVRYTGDQLIINFNHPKHARGPFLLSWGMEHITSDATSNFSEDEFNVPLSDTYKINLNISKNKSFKFWLRLDGNLIYQNNFYSDDDPLF